VSGQAGNGSFKEKSHKYFVMLCDVCSCKEKELLSVVPNTTLIIFYTKFTLVLL